MKSISLLACSLAVAFASPLLPVSHQFAIRDTASSLDALLATVKTHTGNINQTLASLPTASNTTAGNSTNDNIQTEFKAIADALNTTSMSIAAASANTATPTPTTKRSSLLFDRATDCDATCQQSAYKGFDSLSAEISYTMEGCITKNAVDISSASSILITVVLALADLTNTCQVIVDGIGGVVVQDLQEALGLEIGGILATLITAPEGIVSSQ